MLYLKLRCRCSRSDHRQGRSQRARPQCTCTICRQRPHEEEHSCPLTSRPRSLPHLPQPPQSESDAAESESVRAVCDDPYSVPCATAATHRLLPLVREPARPRFHTAANRRTHYNNNHPLPESARDSSDACFSTRNHGQCYCLDAATAVELRQTHHHDTFGAFQL